MEKPNTLSRCFITSWIPATYQTRLAPIQLNPECRESAATPLIGWLGLKRDSDGLVDFCHLSTDFVISPSRVKSKRFGWSRTAFDSHPEAFFSFFFLFWQSLQVIEENTYRRHPVTFGRIVLSIIGSECLVGVILIGEGFVILLWCTDTSTTHARAKVRGNLGYVLFVVSSGV